MDQAQSRVDIHEKNTVLQDAVLRGEAQGVAAVYSEDAVVLPPGGRLYQGRDEIRDMWGLMITNGLKEFHLSPLKVQADGKMAYEYGEASVDVELESGESYVESAKYVSVWRRSHEEWRLHVHIWNTSTPPNAS
jgi:uncharacterized protein (TIGR02246 family)